MHLGLTIAGTWNKINSLAVGEEQVFDGAGEIKCSTLSRSSKNKYKVYAILDTETYDISMSGIKNAVTILQAIYDVHGGLAGSMKKAGV